MFFSSNYSCSVEVDKQQLEVLSHLCQQILELVDRVSLLEMQITGKYLHVLIPYSCGARNGSGAKNG